MKLFTTLALASMGIATITLLSSCQDEDFGYTTQDVRNGLYARNFENHYGKVASDQTWDFSSFNLNRLGLEGGPTSSSMTRAATPYTGQVSATSASGINTSTSDNYYTVDPNTIAWLNNNLKEGIDNRRLGNPFSLVVSRDDSNNKLDFVIIPIYQGQAGMQWDLHLVAKDPTDQQLKDYTVWTKSGDIQYQNNYNNWVEFFYDSDSADDYDTDNKSSANSTLKLKNAFPNISSVSSGDVKIRFVIPAGKKIEGKFVINDSQDNLPDVLKPASNYSWNNESGSTDMTVDIDLSSLNKSQFADLQFQFWNATRHYINNDYQPNFVNCYEEVRLHVYTLYNYTSDWTTPPTDSFTGGHTINRTSVRSKGIIIESDKIDDDFFLYLKVTKGQNNYASDNACQRSDEGMMLALTNCTAPTNLKADIKTLTGLDMAEGEFFIIGCEDANQGGSDHDINDVCFLIAGLPKAPKIKETIKKRYMIEDLGSTFDWDFNDIVVDVTQTRLKSVSGVIDNSQIHTFATLYHLCGTIPFKVQVGNTVLGSGYKEGVYPGTNANCATGGDGYKPQDNDVYYTENRLKNVPVTGWVPEDNNITVTTWPGYAGWNPYNGQENGLEDTPLTQGAESFCFPKSGTKFPYIIACDQDIEPQKEGINVPVSWFWTKPVIEDNNNTGGDNNNPQQQEKTKEINLDETVNFKFPDNDDWEYYCSVSGDQFNNVQVGDKIVVDINGRWEWAQVYLKVKDSNWNELSNNTHLYNGNNTLTYIINDESTLNNIKTNGIAIQGKGFDLKKVSVQQPQNFTLSFGEMTNGSATGAGEYNEGSQVTIEAIPADGYYFDQWSDGDATNPRTITINSDVNLTASFTNQAPTYLWKGTAVSNSWSDNPTVTLNFRGQTYEVGDKLVIITDKRDGANLNIAFNNWGYIADGAEGRPKPNATQTGYELTLNQEMVNALNSNKTITINAENVTVTQIDLVKPASYTINVASANAGQGSVSIVGKDGSTFTGRGDIQLKATPSTGYKFASWTKPDGSTSNDNPLNVTLSESTAGNYTATFAALQQYSVTASANDANGGSVSISPTANGTAADMYYEQTNITLTAVPNAHYSVTNWNKNGTPLNVTSNTLSNQTVTGSTTYEVVFEKDPLYSITASVADGAPDGTSVSITTPADEDGKYFKGTKVTITASVPDGNYNYSWTKNGSATSYKTASITVDATENAEYVLTVSEKTSTEEVIEMKDITSQQEFTIEASKFVGPKCTIQYEVTGNGQFSATSIEIYNQQKGEKTLNENQLNSTKTNGLKCTLYCYNGSVSLKVTITNYE